MIEVSAAWNQAYRSIAGTSTLYLGVRLRTPPQVRRLPVHAVVLLDLSKSMEGAKLLSACEAVSTLWQQLRDGDFLSMVSFASQARQVLPWSEKGRAPNAHLRTTLERCRADGVTNLRAGLQEALHVAGQSPAGGARFIWLVTDGDPTGADGQSATDLGPYLEDAAAGAQSGLVLGALGVGRAEDYRADFLRDLSDRGRGAFCYAPTPEQLGTLLQQQLASAQRVTAVGGQISLSLRPGNTLLAAARMVPSYAPLDLSGGSGAWSIAVGPLAQPETLVLCEIATAAPFGAGMGVHEIGSLQVTAESSGQRHEAPMVALRLHDVVPGSRELLDRDRLIDQLRISLLMSRNVAIRERASTVTEKLRATEMLIDLSRKTGDGRLIERLQREATQLQRNQILTRDQEAQASQDIRATSMATYQQHAEEGQ